MQLAPLGFLTNGFQGALPEQVHFILVHGAPKPQQEAIVYETGIVHPLRVDHQSVDQAAQFNQVMPVSTVSGQARSFNTEHGSHLPGADFGHQMFKAWAFHQATTGTAQIVVYGRHLLEAQRPRIVGEPVLPSLAFPVVQYLGWCRLADVDNGFAA